MRKGRSLLVLISSCCCCRDTTSSNTQDLNDLLPTRRPPTLRAAAILNKRAAADQLDTAQPPPKRVLIHPPPHRVTSSEAQDSSSDDELLPESLYRTPHKKRENISDTDLFWTYGRPRRLDEGEKNECKQKWWYSNCTKNYRTINYANIRSRLTTENCIQLAGTESSSPAQGIIHQHFSSESTPPQ